MSIDKIVGFLQAKPGYSKKGVKKLRAILQSNGINASNAMIQKALQQFRAQLKPTGNNIITNKPLSDVEQRAKAEGLSISSVWTKADGSTGLSYKNEKCDKEDFLDQLKSFKEGFIEDIKNLKNFKAGSWTTNGDSLLEISIPDFHFGKIDGLTIEEQSEKFIQAIVELYNKAAGFNIERVLLPIGNDLFNTDNLYYTTTKGTNQQDNTDWQTSFRVGWRSVISAISFLRQQGLPVTVLIVQGNHDYERSFYLGEVIESYYHSDVQVKVENSINSPRKYFKYGKTLLGFTHGDKERPSDLPLLMAKEAKLDWADSLYQEWHIGHLHKHIHDEYMGVGVKVLPSLVGQDEWHKKMGYTSNKRAQAYIWNKESGLEGFLQINKQ